jgi:hypothetical protein
VTMFGLLHEAPASVPHVKGEGFRLFCEVERAHADAS